VISKAGPRHWQIELSSRSSDLGKKFIEMWRSLGEVVLLEAALSEVQDAKTLSW